MGPKPGVFQLLLPLRGGGGGFSGGRRVFQLGLSFCSVPSSAVSREGPEHPTEIKSRQTNLHPRSFIFSKSCFWMSLQQLLSGPSPSHGILSGFCCELPKVPISKRSVRTCLYTKPLGNKHVLAPKQVSRVNSQPPFPKRSFEMSTNAATAKCSDRRLSGMRRIAR